MEALDSIEWPDRPDFRSDDRLENLGVAQLDAASLYSGKKGFLYRWQEVLITANRKYLKVNNYNQFESFFQNARDK